MPAPQTAIDTPESEVALSTLQPAIEVFMSHNGFPTSHCEKSCLGVMSYWKASGLKKR